jgi:hypothetical protein
MGPWLRRCLSLTVVAEFPPNFEPLAVARRWSKARTSITVFGITCSKVSATTKLIDFSAKKADLTGFRTLRRPECNLENAVQAKTNLRQTRQVGLAIERCILNALLHPRELDDLVSESGIQYAAGKPDQELPLRVIPRALKALAT